MRVTGGVYLNRTVVCPPGEIRPAMDRMRESLFSILGRLDGLSFLDLFSGSGIIAIEALSRGADTVAMVEKDRRKRPTLLKNLAICSEQKEQWNLFIRPAEAYLKTVSQSFDLVYMDPPFSMKNKAKLLLLAHQAHQPAPGGTLIIHFPAEEPLPEEVGSLIRSDTRAYGRSHLAFYTKD